MDLVILSETHMDGIREAAPTVLKFLPAPCRKIKLLTRKSASAMQTPREDERMGGT